MADMTEAPNEMAAETRKPTHYCVHCAARWLKHPDETWSVLTDCGPCCNNTPMDEAPLIEFQPDGTLNGDDYDRVKEAFESRDRERQVDSYQGILCARCDAPFEQHSRSWVCPHRVTPRFKFPPEPSPTPARQFDAGEVEGLVEQLRKSERYFDSELADLVRANLDTILAALTDSAPAPDGLVERDCAECGGTGDAEHIDGYARPCDACRGEGILRCTELEAALLDQVEEMSARLRSLAPATDEAAERQLHKALKPFADEAANYDYGDGSGPDYDDAPDASSLNEITDLTVGDLRRARAALSSLSLHPGSGAREALKAARVYIATDLGCGVVQGEPEARRVLALIDASLPTPPETPDNG